MGYGGCGVPQVTRCGVRKMGKNVLHEAADSDFHSSDGSLAIEGSWRTPGL